MPLYPIDYNSQSSLRAAWSWQTRVSLGPKFGNGCSIHHYQNEQAAISDEIELRLAREIPGVGVVKVRTRTDAVGRVQVEAESTAGWVSLGTVADILAGARR